VSPRLRFAPDEEHDGRPRRSGPARSAMLAIWIAFVVFPPVNAVTSADRGTRYWLAIAGTLLFSALYMWLVLIWADLRGGFREVGISLALALIALGLTLIVNSNWGYLFTYVAACAALSAPSAFGFPAVLMCAAAGTGAAVAAGGGSSSIGIGASTLGVGLLLTLLRDLRQRNAELSRARAELARTAVAAERERFARDLHDLLGHSLSVIAIKAELAGRLLPDAPSRAASEVADLETVARSALREVRDAVSGYRRPTLEGELEGARMALAAAGIIAAIEHASDALSPEIEAVLAWSVREGATNVIRHSGARHCEVRVHGGSGEVAVEILDDGRGAGENSACGNGLAGLRERATAVRGRLEAGAGTSGGFRLAVSVPLPGGELTP
jgi:two-component system, NarL family, sensor histidine kinase DesK